MRYVPTLCSHCRYVGTGKFGDYYIHEQNGHTFPGIKRGDNAAIDTIVSGYDNEIIKEAPKEIRAILARNIICET